MKHNHAKNAGQQAGFFMFNLEICNIIKLNLQILAAYIRIELENNRFAFLFLCDTKLLLYDSYQQLFLSNKNHNQETGLFSCLSAGRFHGGLYNACIFIAIQIPAQ